MVYCLYSVCLGLFAFPLDVFGRLCSLIVALPKHFLHYYYVNILWYSILYAHINTKTASFAQLSTIDGCPKVHALYI